MKINLSVHKIVTDLELEVLAGKAGLSNLVRVEMLTRPGVELAGFFKYFDSDRMMLIGSKEATFFDTLPKSIQEERLEHLFKSGMPGVVFSRNVIINPLFDVYAEKYSVPLIKSQLRTTPISSKLYSYLQEHLADRLTVHGVLLDIHGMGTLITGKSGIGKSETALELIHRGHQLISDDRVDLFQKDVGILIGEAPKVLKRYLEIRGIGIVDVVSMFGVSAFRETKKVRLVVELEKWQDGKQYDRLGLETEKIRYFDTVIPKVVIPVLPGRNVAMLVESASMNEKLKFLGDFSAEKFIEAVGKLSRKTQEDES